MRIHDLHPAPGAVTTRRRLGRGYGSGRGKTAGRGTKGQKARTGGQIPRWFEGGQTPLHKRLPFKKGFRSPNRISYEIINVERLNGFANGDEITRASLAAAGLVKIGDPRPIKILAEGDLTVSLTVNVERVSAGARVKIEAAGGRIIGPAAELPAETAE